MPDVLPSSPPEPRRARLIEYGRDSGAVRRWLRQTFTHDNVTSALKTLAWVVPLTILIWVYAEREQLYKDQGVPIPINASTGDPTRVVTLLRPGDKMILADLEGPRSKIDAVRNEFARSGGIEAVEILLDRLQLAVGTHELRTASLLNAQAMFGERGITVTNCQPPTLHVLIDEYETRELPVEAPPSITNLVGPKVFEPARVKVRAPSRQFDEAGHVGVYADLASISELATPGPHEIPAVRVYVPNLEGANVVVSPSTVKATLEVRHADERHVLPFMAVYAVMPTAMQRQYRVECQETIPNVTLVGPPDKIAPLKQPDYDGPRPYAAVEVTGDDRPAPGQDVGPVRTRRLKYFDLPEGVRVSSDDAQRTVDFKLVARAVEP